MAKDYSTGILQVNESEIRSYLDRQVKEAVKQALEEIMNAEAEELLCAGHYERSPERKDYRNGTRKRKLKTRVGEIELSVPRLRTLASHFGKLLPEACNVLAEGLEETLTFYSCPRKHWRHIRSNNPLERLFREVRRRTRVVGTFPDLSSCLMLAAARLKRTEERRWGKKRYMDTDLLLEDLIEKAKEVEATQ